MFTMLRLHRGRLIAAKVGRTRVETILRPLKLIMETLLGTCPFDLCNVLHRLSVAWLPR